VTLSDEELDRYARHIVLPEIGGAGQLRLRSAHAAVIGAGGIGAPLIQYLAAAGIGRLTIIDDDRVSLSNLQRQTLFATEDEGRPKTDVASNKVAGLNPGVSVTSQTIRIAANNAEELLGGVDVIVDGSDNFETRLLVADTAHRLRIPLISSSVARFQGQLGVFRGWEANKPCYRCFVGGDPEQPEQSCADVGVLGAMAGVMGSLAAMEAIRAIVPFGEDSAGKLLLADAISLRFRTVSLPKDPECRTCRD
jgi:molybdopterin-synthase adenylyltransferase